MTSSTKTTKETTMNTTALADQVDAANRHVTDVYELLAQRIKGHVTHGNLSPRMRLLAETLGARILEGRTAMCRDLSWTAPAPAFWMPYAPGLIRCQGCVAVVTRRIKGTEQDYRCDGCGRYSRPLHAQGFLIPARVLDVPEVPFAAVSPAITVSYGLCVRCRTE